MKKEYSKKVKFEGFMQSTRIWNVRMKEKKKGKWNEKESAVEECLQTKRDTF